MRKPAVFASAYNERVCERACQRACQRGCERDEHVEGHAVLKNVRDTQSAQYSDITTVVPEHPVRQSHTDFW